MKKFLLICTAIIFTCTQAMAFDVSPTQTNVGIKKSPNKVVISPDLIDKLFTHKSLTSGIEMLIATDDGNRLSSLRGTLSSPLNGDLTIATREYLKEHASLFNLPNKRNGDLKLIKNLSRDNSTHISYQMFVGEVPVHQAKIELHLNKDGVITLANGSLPTIEDINNSISLSKYQAIGMAKQAIKIKKMRGLPTANVELIPNNNKEGTLAYITRIPSADPLGDYEIIIDAQTGELISYNNQMNFKTGTGALYKTNPIRCDITKEPLKHLTTNTLTGKWVKVINEKSATSVSETNTHIYTPESTHFDEVGMYYYVNNIHDFFVSLGYNGMRSITAVVHHRDKYDNAYFSPWQNRICFGDGSRFNCLAREAAITYHEYSHAVLHSITYLAYSGESGAINEGQADYFACSLTNDPHLGEWVCAKMDRPYLRNLENNLHYPENIEGEVHADGKIWGGTLWDIRKAIGKSAADLLIHNSHFYLNGSSPKFLDGFNALITADKDLFQGKYQKDLHKIFSNRGIVTSSYNGIALTGNEHKTIKRFKDSHEK